QSPGAGHAAMCTAPSTVRHGRSSWMKVLDTSLIRYAATTANGAASASPIARASPARARHQPTANSATNTRSPASVPTSATVCSHDAGPSAHSVTLRYRSALNSGASMLPLTIDDDPGPTPVRHRAFRWSSPYGPPPRPTRPFDDHARPGDPHAPEPSPPGPSRRRAPPGPPSAAALPDLRQGTIPFPRTTPPVLRTMYTRILTPKDAPRPRIARPWNQAPDRENDHDPRTRPDTRLRPRPRHHRPAPPRRAGRRRHRHHRTRTPPRTGPHRHHPRRPAKPRRSPARHPDRPRPRRNRPPHRRGRSRQARLARR